MRHDHFRNGFRRGAALLMALLLGALCAVPALAAETAATMQLVKTEGTVTVTNRSGKTLSIRNNMRLYNGYHVQTDAAGYAWINLDDTKLAKLDEVSEAEIRKSGKKLELLVSSGSVFFDVTEPLKDDETLNVCTSTMIMGIRGTSGIVAAGQDNTSVYILEGSVECVLTDPATGQSQTASVGGGQMLSISTSGGQLAVAPPASFDMADIGGFVLTELANDEALCAKIKELSGLDIQVDAAAAQARLAADQAQTQQEMDAAAAAQGTQAGGAVVDSSFGYAGASSSSDDSSDSDDNSGSTTPEKPDKPDQPDKPDKPDQPDKPDKPDTSDPTKKWLTVDSSIADIQAALDDSAVKTVYVHQTWAGSLFDGSTLTIAGGETLTVPEGKTLFLGDSTAFKGVDFEIKGTLNVKGTLKVLGKADVAGTFTADDDAEVQVDQGLAVKANGTLTIKAAAVNTGSGCVVEDGGTLTMTDAATLKTDGNTAALTVEANATATIGSNTDTCTIDGGERGTALMSKTTVDIIGAMFKASSPEKLISLKDSGKLNYGGTAIEDVAFILAKKESGGYRNGGWTDADSSTLKSLFQDAKEDDVVVALRDVDATSEGSSTWESSGNTATVKVDLNGKELKYTKLTIKDKFELVGTTSGSKLTTTNGMTAQCTELTIRGGEYDETTGSNPALTIEGGEVTLDGGVKMSSKADMTVKVDNSGSSPKLNLKNCEIVNNSASGASSMAVYWQSDPVDATTGKVKTDLLTLADGVTLKAKKQTVLGWDTGTGTAVDAAGWKVSASADSDGYYVLEKDNTPS